MTESVKLVNEEDKLTEGEILVLSILSEQPNYPYGIQKIIDERQAHNWVDIGFSSIYHALDRFERRGFVQSKYKQPITKDDKKSKRKQKWYSLSSKGKRILKTNVAYLISKYTENSPSSIGFANFPIFTKNELSNLLQARRTEVQKRILHVEKRKQSELRKIRDKTHFVLLDLLFDYSLARHKTELQFIETIEKKWIDQNDKS